METRAQTLDAIQQYITTQRALLSRTQADIDRLLELRKKAIAKPREFLDGCLTNISSFKLTDLAECAPARPQNIDWSLYMSLDPTPLRALIHNTTYSHSHTYPKTPHKTQLSPLSPLQRLVKEARVSILEPILGPGLGMPGTGTVPGSVGVSSPGGISSETIGGDGDGLGDGTTDVRGGKKKKGGLTVVLPAQSPVQLRTRSSNGVFLLTPASSTSTTTPTTAYPSRSRTRRLTATTAKRHSRGSTVDLNNSPATPTFSFASPTPIRTSPSYQSQTTTETYSVAKSTTRTRRPSAKFSKGDFVDSTPMRKRRSSTLIKNGEDVTTPLSTPGSSAVADAPPTKLGKRARRASSPSLYTPNPHSPSNTTMKIKIKPETYKKAWSVSEQHLLERLLDEIPEGEKNRWQKISQGMQGRRTPRQVASRVQKYFEKLKRFGVGVGLDDPRWIDQPNS